MTIEVTGDSSCKTYDHDGMIAGLSFIQIERSTDQYTRECIWWAIA